MEIQMRTLLLLSAVAILGACSDNQSTAPTASRSPSRSAAGDVSPSNPGSGGQAKPQDLVGFTTVTTVTGSTAYLNVNVPSNTSTATCPAGTHVVGGGYAVTGITASLQVQRTAPNNTNGWTVSALLDGLQNSGEFVATAICIS